MTLKRLASLSCLAVMLFSCILPAEARRRRRHHHVRHAPAAAASGAKHKVALLSFSGPGGAAARNGVAQGLGRHAAPIKAGLFEKTAKELGVNAEDAAGIVAVCAKLKCDAVVTGVVQKQGGRLTLTVTVFNGGTGEALGRRQAAVRSNRRLAAAGSAIGAQSAALVAQGKYRKSAPPAPAPAPVAKAPPQPEPEKVPEYKPPTEQEPAAKPSKSRRRDDEEGTSEEEEGVSKRERVGGRTYVGLFDVSFALGASTRSAKLSVDGSTADPFQYDGGVYPEFTLHLDFFPLVLATKGFLKNLGIGASYTRHITISTTDAAGNPVDSSSQELLVDLRLHWVFFNRDTSPEATVLAGFGMRQFDLGDSNNAVLPSFDPKFIRFGLEGAVPFGTPYIGAGAGFDARVLVGAGANAVYHLGEKTGGFGFAVRGGLQGRLPFGLCYFAGVEFLRFSMSFAGLGTVEEPLDRASPTSLVDQYVRFWAGAGYAY